MVERELTIILVGIAGAGGYYSGYLYMRSKILGYVALAIEELIEKVVNPLEEANHSMYTQLKELKEQREDS